MSLVMTPAVRMSAEDRRADVLRVAVAEFAKHGFEGTSTEDVARAAGISQPYLFRLFPTKKALFLALVEHGFSRVRDAFTTAVGDRTGDDALEAMGEAYGELLRDRDELMLQLQAYAACDDPEIGAVTRREFGRLWRDVSRHSGTAAPDRSRSRRERRRPGPPSRRTRVPWLPPKRLRDPRAATAGSRSNPGRPDGAGPGDAT